MKTMKNLLAKIPKLEDWQLDVVGALIGLSMVILAAGMLLGGLLVGA